MTVSQRVREFIESRVKVSSNGKQLLLVTYRGPNGLDENSIGLGDLPDPVGPGLGPHEGVRKNALIDALVSVCTEAVLLHDCTSPEACSVCSERTVDQVHGL